jgi:arylsulfatase A-like enzyme
VDDVATDFALDFIRKHRDRPFSLVLGFKTPHADFAPPERLRKAFEGRQLGPPVNFHNLAVYVGRVQLVRKEDIKPGGNRRVDDPLDYFRGLVGVDQNVGRVLALLDQLGLARDTVVVYTSDNGYHLGDHGIGDKRSAYEESMRVPMLLRYPRVSATRGKVVDAMVLNIDLAPTLIDLAGLPTQPDMQGRSWRPLLEGRDRRVRDRFLYTYFYYRDISDYELQTANPPITPTIVALRTETAKLITYPGRSWVELFDLVRDPHEQTNLAADPRHARMLADLRAELAAERTAVGYQVPAGLPEAPADGLEDWKK